MSESPAKLEQKLGYHFKDPVLLERALTHSSWAGEKGTADNQRLEFLGDAVLSLATSDLLCRRIEEARGDEGHLSRMRAGLVSGPTLARVATELGLGPYLLLGRGEQRSGGAAKARILEDALEALIAAVFLDSDYPTVRAVVEGLFTKLIEEGGLARPDPKSALQELLAERGRGRPDYRIVSRSGPDHMPIYEVELSESGQTLARGSGPGRRAAERDAARRAITELGEKQ